MCLVFTLHRSGVEKEEEDEVKQLLTDWVTLLDNEIEKKPKVKKDADKKDMEAKGVIIRDAAMKSLKPGQ